MIHFVCLSQYHDKFVVICIPVIYSRCLLKPHVTYYYLTFVCVCDHRIDSHSLIAYFDHQPLSQSQSYHIRKSMALYVKQMHSLVFYLLCLMELKAVWLNSGLNQQLHWLRTLPEEIRRILLHPSDGGHLSVSKSGRIGAIRRRTSHGR